MWGCSEVWDSSVKESRCNKLCPLAVHDREVLILQNAVIKHGFFCSSWEEQLTWASSLWLQDSPQQVCPLQQCWGSTCSFSLFSQPSGTWILVCEALLTSAVSSRLLTASTECFGIFLLWKCNKEVLKNQTQLLGMQWEVSGLGCLLSLCRVLAWEISWLQCHPFPCYTIKMGKSQVLAACSSIDTNHPVLSQCSRAAIIITTDMAKPVTLYSPSGVCVRADPRTISCLVWACCALTPGGVTSTAFRSHHRWNCTTNQNSSERQMILKWKGWAHTWKTNLWDLSRSHFLILIKIKSWRKSHYIFHWFGALDFLRLFSAF